MVLRASYLFKTFFYNFQTIFILDKSFQTLTMLGINIIKICRNVGENILASIVTRKPLFSLFLFKIKNTATAQFYQKF